MKNDKTFLELRLNDALHAFQAAVVEWKLLSTDDSAARETQRLKAASLGLELGTSLKGFGKDCQAHRGRVVLCMADGTSLPADYPRLIYSQSTLEAVVARAATTNGKREENVAMVADISTIKIV